MKDEYHFTAAERGRFPRPDAILSPPVRLAPDVLAFLSARAQARGMTPDDLVNTLLKDDIERIGQAE
jgi:hypothetical protein